MYQNLVNGQAEEEREDSVHYLFIPEANEDAVDPDMER
jgi:hypothetical protein